VKQNSPQITPGGFPHAWESISLLFFPMQRSDFKAEVTPEQEWDKEASHPSQEGEECVPACELVNRLKAAGTKGNNWMKHLSEL